MNNLIQDAIEGGWTPPIQYIYSEEYNNNIQRFVIDPKFWQAVGKTRKWKPYDFTHESVWKKKMHEMIDHLIEGGTINSFIETL